MRKYLINYFLIWRLWVFFLFQLFLTECTNLVLNFGFSVEHCMKNALWWTQMQKISCFVLAWTFKNGLPHPRGSVFHWTSWLSHNRDLWNWIWNYMALTTGLLTSAAASHRECCIENLDQGLRLMPAPYLGWRLVLYNKPCSFPRTKHLCA